MNNISKLSYKVALGAITLLITWCIATLIVNAFELSVFERKTTEFLTLAILPILATVAGAGMINVISNISIISNHITQRETVEKPSNERLFIRIFFIINILIIISLGIGDKISSKKKELAMSTELEYIIESNSTLFKSLPQPDLTPEFITSSSRAMKYIGNSNSKLDDPSIIFQCTILGQKSLCSISNNDDNKIPIISKLMNNENDVNTDSISIDTLKYIYKDDETIKAKIQLHIDQSISKPFLENTTKSNFNIFKQIRIGNTNCILRMNKYDRHGSFGS